MGNWRSKAMTLSDYLKAIIGAVGLMLGMAEIFVGLMILEEAIG